MSVESNDSEEHRLHTSNIDFRNRKLYALLSFVLIIGGTIGGIITWSIMDTNQKTSNISPSIDGIIEYDEWKLADGKFAQFLDVNNSLDEHNRSNIDTFNYLYVGQDSDNLYIAADLCGDRTNDFDGEWISFWLNTNWEINETKKELEGGTEPSSSAGSNNEFLNYLNNGTEILGYDVNESIEIPTFAWENGGYGIESRNMGIYNKYVDFIAGSFQNVTVSWDETMNSRYSMWEDSYESDPKYTDLVAFNDTNGKITIDVSINVTEYFETYWSDPIMMFGWDEYEIEMILESFETLNTSFEYRAGAFNRTETASIYDSNINSTNPNAHFNFDEEQYEMEFVENTVGEYYESEDIVELDVPNIHLNETWYNFTIELEDLNDYFLLMDLFNLKLEIPRYSGIVGETSLNEYDIEWSYGKSPNSDDMHRMFEAAIPIDEIEHYDPSGYIGVAIKGYGTMSYDRTNHYVMAPRFYESPESSSYNFWFTKMGQQKEITA